ncbi:PREDICTED: 29 kDa ribonucleoprotein B, chloroplastic-like [Camelina sativa]|uniref:29 kDa ribonucleoprotein B, chloroplastic-like n=1 Tax=Camelina sativa TaxID=90675 RepID=A0ABM1REN4_CAMSA|nr:PREDICTED: 29 kDa ribonucleoprotein B, chloroplastic-like [Camelina sativa]
MILSRSVSVLHLYGVSSSAPSKLLSQKFKVSFALAYGSSVSYRLSSMTRKDVIVAAQTGSDKPKPNKEPLYPETEHKRFVGNLSCTVTSESLAGAFRECGDVVGVRVVFDGDTGRLRGYGFL